MPAGEAVTVFEDRRDAERGKLATTSVPRALKLRTGVGRFELDAHRAAEAGLQRFAAVQRNVEKHGVDHPASRLDSSCVEARLLHDTAA